VSAVHLRGVPGRAVVAIAVLMTTMLVEGRRGLVLSRSSHVVVVVTTLSPTPLMLWQRRNLRLLMEEKGSGNTMSSV
jgi:hypothetical protein